MVLAFVEDGTLELHESEEAAAAAYEGVDVESGVVFFYRDDGAHLKPVFTIPNRYGRFLGVFRWSQSGQYHLIPDQDVESDDPLWLALFEHQHLQPGGRFTTIDQLRAHLISRGAVVDRPASEA